MEKYQLMSFFYELIRLGIDLPGRPGYGSPISWLLEQMCIRQEHFLARICGDFTGDSHEWRINSAGLKFHWRVCNENDKRKFKCYISGDQARDYPGFVVAANNLINKFNYNNR